MALTTKGIDHVNLQVSALEATVNFWRVLLGFGVLERIPDQNGAIIGNKEAKLALYQNSAMGEREKNGFSHLCFYITNFDEALALCASLNIPVLYEGIVSWPKSKSLYIEDPNGYEIELTDTWGGALA